MSEYLSFGEIMLRLKSPAHERLFQSPQLEATFGGGEANVAVALANFGLDSGFVSVLPDNDIGAAAIRELRGFGVDTRHVRRAGAQVVGDAFLDLAPAVARGADLHRQVWAAHHPTGPPRVEAAGLGDQPADDLLGASRPALQHQIRTGQQVGGDERRGPRGIEQGRRARENRVGHGIDLHGTVKA